MGVISRRVLPACANLACLPCPSLRSRSKKPLKRYNKLLNNIYPNKQDAAINERAIGKLADYAEQNPVRIPKIVNKLEQRAVKDKQTHQLGSLKAGVRAYCKLLSACKSHMSLFALSALSVIKDLLDDRNPQLHILGCQMFAEFTVNQVDTTYTYEIDKLLPSLVAVTRETAEEKNQRELKAAGLHALATVIWYTQEFSHIPPDFDSLVATVLDNYVVLPVDGHQSHRLHGLKEEALSSVHKQRESAERMRKAGKSAFLPRDLGYLTKTELEHPELWAHVCIRGLAKVASGDATTAQRVLVPLLQYFDNGEHWEPLPGALAVAVLLDLQEEMDTAGSHATLVRHLEHPSVRGQLTMQVNIVKTISVLARHPQTQSSGGGTAVVAAMTDLSQLLRRSFEATKKAKGESEFSGGLANLAEQKNFQDTIEECLVYLAKMAGAARPLLDMMAFVLESLSGDAVRAQATMDALLVVAHAVVVASETVPDQQAFPDNLLFQLLQAMAHPDPATRISTHRLLSLLLLSPAKQEEKEAGREDTLLPFGGRSVKDSSVEESARHSASHSHLMGRLHSLKAGMERNFSRRLKLHETAGAAREPEEKVGRLTASQASLLLSSLWLQSSLPSNTSGCYAAMSTTFFLIVTSSTAKTHKNTVFVRAMQLALSLRTAALEGKDPLPPAMRQPLFTLSVAMLLQVAQTFKLPHIQGSLKSSLAEAGKDSLLELRDDGTLLERSGPISKGTTAENGGGGDAALTNMKQTKNETLAGIVQLILADIPSLEVEVPDAPSLLLLKFEPDDLYMVHPRNLVVPEPPSDAAGTLSGESVLEVEDLPVNGLGEEELFRPQAAKNSAAVEDAAAAPSVEELLQHVSSDEQPQRESGEPLDASEWARSLPVQEDDESSTLEIPYMAPEEEAEGGSMQREKADPGGAAGGQKDLWDTLLLPPVSPFDNFLKAAGC